MVHTTETVGSDDARAVLATVERFCRDAIEPATARPERPLDATGVQRLCSDAAEVGIIVGPPSDAGGVGLWQGLDNEGGLALSLAMLDRLAQSNAGVAFQLHQLALGQHLVERLQLHADGWTLAALQGRLGMGRQVALTPLGVGPGWSEAQALWRDTFATAPGPFAPLTVQAAEGWNSLLVPVLRGEPQPHLTWATYGRADVQAQALTHNHGLDETVLWQVQVPALQDAHASRPDADAAVWCEALGLATVATVALGHGALRRALDMARRYAHDRAQGGRPIGEYAAVQLMLGEAIAIHGAIGAMLQSVRAVPQQPAQLKTLVQIRAVAQPLLSRAANLALQVFGGMGYMQDTGLEKILRDINHLRLVWGAPDELRLWVNALEEAH